MHEYSIVSALLERVEAEAAAKNATGVRRVEVRIGENAGVEVDLLRTAYDMSREGTICAGAELAVERVPVRWSCLECGRPPERGARLVCPVCGSSVRLVSGDEIVLARLELEVP